MIIPLFLVDSTNDPSRESSRCPATMFAVSRTHSVIGRIMFLTSSISTMKFIKVNGVPCGTMWDNMCLVLLIHPIIIILVQAIRAIGKFNEICEVVENTNG